MLNIDVAAVVQAIGTAIKLRYIASQVFDFLGLYKCLSFS